MQRENDKNQEVGRLREGTQRANSAIIFIALQSEKSFSFLSSPKRAPHLKAIEEDGDVNSRNASPLLNTFEPNL